jgi:NitT/TauT family transport system ATP-binding protein
MTALVELSQVSKSFGPLQVIHRLDLTIDRQDVISLIGPSGCGKSTTLRVIAGLEQVDMGMVKRRFSQPAFVFQEPRLLPWQTALENIQFVLYDRVPDREERQRIVNHYLELMGLEKFARFYPAQLSGGMKKRVSIARALAIEPDLILMDEPLSDLDLPLRLLLIENLRRILIEDSRTVVYVTHDIRDALLLSHNIYVLTAKPMTIKNTIHIHTGMDRKMSNPELLKLEGQVIESLEEESLRTSWPVGNQETYSPVRKRRRRRRYKI